ncbi:MAG: DNA-3-methyladenine glycosylase [Candidatus Lokiarchaeota archaeon]|nr:DNA-3-methyladenine glycosylase [Candidatus Lokiarchaeota archaeon]
MTVFKRLNREFFSRNTITVAKELLGKYLIRETEKGTMVGEILEVEAYLGTEDKACHSYNYKKTERTKVMYEKPGTFYVYLIYGMYHCLNVITEPKAIPCAVLIRQVYPIDGIELIVENRKIKARRNFKNLTDGPGKLCMAFNITKDEFNGKDSCVNDSKLFFTHTEKQLDKTFIVLKRIGIDYAEEDKDKLLRFKLIK